MRISELLIELQAAKIELLTRFNAGEDVTGLNNRLTEIRKAIRKKREESEEEARP